jgi:polar amino acid transport system substrate-binding protein
VRRRSAALVLVCALAVAVCGCASVSDTAQNRSLAALKTQDPKPLAGLPDLEGTPACERHPYRSLAPGALPRPGHMPPGTLMATIQRRGRLYAGVDQNTLGLGYFDPTTKQMEGFDIDVVRKVAQAIFGGDDPDHHIRYTALSTQQRDAAIPFHNVDIIASAYTVNCARRRRVRFSSVYHRAHTRLLVPVDSKVESLKDLVGQPVCATTASTTATILDDAGAKTYRAELRSDCLLALQERVVPAVSSDDAILLGLCRQDPQTKIVGPIKDEYVQPYGLAMDPHQEEFVRFVNAVLKRMDLKKLRRHWLKSLGERPSSREIKRCGIPGT